METVEYSTKALQTDMGYPANIPPLFFNALAICEEAGEFAGKIKKVYRDNHGCFNPDDIHALMLEAGDILWYLNRAAEDLRNRMAGFSLAEQVGAGMIDEFSTNAPGHGLEIIAELNLLKLKSRAERGMIQGSGDDR